jgi:hypothetical protein
MKNALMIILAAGLGALIARAVVSAQLDARYARQMADQQQAWQFETTALQAELDRAKTRARTSPPAVAAPAPAPISDKPTPAQIVAKLVALKSGANPTRTAREAICLLEELIAAGPASLPAIREFLARNQDVDFLAANQGKGVRGGVPSEFVAPPSLRFGLLDAVRQIRGPESEKLLAEMLGVTLRGAEISWLARTLQDIAPDKYRDLALTTAREVLARPAGPNSPYPLDRNEREQLFGILMMYGDSSFAAAAQAQVLRADGEVDRGVLRYLQQVLGQQAVPFAVQWYDDPRLADPAKKEPFARLALNYVGADNQATELYLKAINDPGLTPDHRKNLIEDLNQDGFGDLKNLSPRDLPLIQNRLALIEKLAPQTADAVNAAAFKEAYKDLVAMRERIINPAAAVK